MLAPRIRNAAAIEPPLCIGDWWVDPAANEIGRARETVRIEPKAMHVLVVLARAAGRVVSREELLSAVWPGVVVGDETLTQAIIKLRRALGDDSRAPSCIETISKRGYRLIARVQRPEDVVLATAGATALDSPAQTPARSRLRAPGPKLVAGIALLLALATAYLFHSVTRPNLDTDHFVLGDQGQPAPLTLTVLPFESLGADEAQAYLARGIGNDLMTDLSRLPGLRLIRASREAPGNPRAQGARYLVSGSVQRVAGTLRINIHLIDTDTNRQLWSERFERPFGDLFAVQDEIVRRLTAVLPGELANAAREKLAGRYTRSLDAYDRFLHAQALFLVRQADENEEARDYYRKALELDPKFARAYAGLAMSYAMDYRLRPSGASSPMLARASELAETARSIDPEIPEVYWALAFVHVQSRRHEQALRLLGRAIELNRSFADAYAFMGGIYNYLGQSAKTIPLLRTALRLNPDGGYLYFLILGRAYLFENDIEQALINLRQAAARNPVDLETRVFLAAALAAAGDDAAAEWEGVEIRGIDGAFSLRTWLESYPMSSPQYLERLQSLLARAGL